MPGALARDQEKRDGIGKNKVAPAEEEAAQDSIPVDRRRMWTNDTLNMTRKPGI